ncbi:MAG: single-stranded-DNA-specific exonuclease RecJ [Clostridia bacterium]|nr:single-stranded-DNA-specific exonuclease RecJ [Clostridia bacterium]
MEINEIVRQILIKRGIVDEEDQLEFISAKPRRAYDPFLLKDMDKAVDIMDSALKAKKKICIYGDYDADGITATALLIEVLSSVCADQSLIGYYIPLRQEGYGLNKEAIKQIADEGYELIVTVDCGSMSKEEVKYAYELGMEILITDHHNVEMAERAEAPLINPKQDDCAYPFKGLAGVGVAFKLAQAMLKKGLIEKEVLTSVADLVAIGTMGDIMPLLDENRTIVKFGLAVINTGHRKGLKLLIDRVLPNAGVISADNVAYQIVPHLNACGRVNDPKDAVDLLISQDDIQLNSLLEKVLDNNSLRKKMQDEDYKTCVDCIGDEGQAFIIVKSNDIHEGIAGIVAGKLKEKFNRPAVVLTPIDGEDAYKGTGRSIDGVNLHDILDEQKDLFDRFGGHAGACGFTLPFENFDKFQENCRMIMARLEADDLDLYQRKYKVDLKIDLADATLSLAQDLRILEPFGEGNKKPLFEIKALSPKFINFMGDNQQHVRFMVGDSKGEALNCVAFNIEPAMKDSLESGERIDIQGNLEINEWNGKSKAQFYVENIKLSQEGNIC